MLARLSTRSRLALRAPAIASRGRALCTGAKDPNAFPETPSIYTDKHLFPDHVLEEEKYGYSAGLPVVRESEIWKEGNEDMLLAERAELWWDDGTAEPEWFVDRGSAGGANGGRSWAMSNGGAAAQLFGMLGFIAVFVGGTAYLIGDSTRPAAPRWDHGYPQDMREQFGLKPLADAEEE